jgi:RHS repeat-associated protein
VTFDDTSTIEYSYDAGDRITQIVDSVNGTIARTYDGLDRLTEETTSQGTIAYTYDNDGRRATLTVDGQTTVNYDYDNAHRLTAITQGSASVTIAYDNADRRSTLTFPNGIVATYGYDSANELTSLAYTLSGNPVGDQTYAYDPAGNRTSVGGSWARTGLPAALTVATYDGANRLVDRDSTGFTYDLNGNLTSDGTNSYTWNARDQLVAMSGSISASFQYDASGRRRGKTISGTTTNFLYDGLNLAQELTSGGTPTANLLTGLGTDETFTRTDASGASALLVDALGSTLELADASGTLQTHYTYDPFGATTALGMSSTNAGQFTGRDNDGTGPYYYRARYYDPKIGRFISEDPIRFEGGINFYVYTGNNPVTFIDSLGLAPSSCCDQDFLTCMAKCLVVYDPLGPRGNIVLTAAGGTFPKVVIGQPTVLGASRMTTIPSAFGGAAVRGVGRFFSPIWITYGNYLFLVEVHCAAACTGFRCSY